MGCIYLIRNTVNGKAYIGKTAQHNVEKRRINQHLDGNGSLVLGPAVKKYGKNAFAYEILHDGIIPELLDSYEIEAIKKYNTLQPNGYNLTIGGEGTVGYKFTAEQCRKMSERRKGKPSGGKGKKWSIEARRKHSKRLKGNTNKRGKKLSAESRNRISEVQKGRKASKETRQKMSGSRSGERNPRFSPMHIPSKQFYFSLPADMSITEKRKRVKEFSGKDAKTVWRWINQWQSETD